MAKSPLEGVEAEQLSPMKKPKRIRRRYKQTVDGEPVEAAAGQGTGRSSGSMRALECFMHKNHSEGAVKCAAETMLEKGHSRISVHGESNAERVDPRKLTDEELRIVRECFEKKCGEEFAKAYKKVYSQRLHKENMEVHEDTTNGPQTISKSQHERHDQTIASDYAAFHFDSDDSDSSADALELVAESVPVLSGLYRSAAVAISSKARRNVEEKGLPQSPAQNEDCGKRRKPYGLSDLLATSQVTFCRFPKRKVPVRAKLKNAKVR